MLKAAILSVSLLTIMASAAISPALGNIAEFFSETDPTLIKLIITLPSMLIIPFAFISGKLCDYFGKRTILFIGLIIYMAGGVLGGFVSSIEKILFMRAVLGIGVGLIMPVSTALISDFYKGSEAVEMTGFVTASNNFGGIVAVIFSGWLAGFSWRYSFFVYLMAVIPFIFVMFFLPEPEKREKTEQTGKLHKITWTASILIFLMMTAFYVIPTNIAIFIKSSHLGNAGTAGLALAFLTTSAFIAGSFFAKLSRVLNKYMAAVQAVLMCLGFYLISNTSSIPVVLISVFLVGFSFGNFYPLILLLVVRNVPKNQNVKSMAIVSSAVFSGQFFSPVFFDSIGKIFGNTNVEFIFLAASVFTGIAAVILILRVFFKGSKEAFEN